MVETFKIKRTVNGKIIEDIIGTNVLTTEGRDYFHTKVNATLTPCKRLKKNKGSCYGKVIKTGHKKGRIICTHCGKILGFAIG